MRLHPLPLLGRVPGFRRLPSSQPQDELASTAPPPTPPARPRSLGRVLLPPAVGVTVGTPLGMLFAGLVAAAILPDGAREYAFLAPYYGANAGCLLGLVTGVCAVLTGRRRVIRSAAAVVGAGLGALHGGWGAMMADSQVHGSVAGAAVGFGAAAGLAGGLILARVLERMRARWERRSAPSAPAPTVGDGAPALPLPAAPPAAGNAAVEALRKQVLRAGRQTLSLRYVVPAGAGFVVVATLAAISDLAAAPYLPIILATAFFPTLLLSYPLSLLFRWLKRRQLRRRLAELPRDDRARVLLSLRQPALPETMEFVEPLLRDLGLPNEVVPSAAADGRGDELTASGGPS